MKQTNKQYPKEPTKQQYPPKKLTQKIPRNQPTEERNDESIFITDKKTTLNPVQVMAYLTMAYFS